MALPIPRAWKNRIKGLHRRLRRSFVERFRSFDAPQLTDALARLGVRQGDAVMVHSAFEPHHGFRGTAQQAIECFADAVGPAGHLLMVSLPYHSASIEYLEKGRRFDVRRTPSAMGLISEYFRRQPGVVRSLHPTHPVLIRGPRAEWFAEGHEDSELPCGEATPFGRLAKAGGKVVFLNVPFAYFTFFHFLEHRVADRVGFPLYAPDSFEVRVVDRGGAERTVHTVAFSRETIKRRRFDEFERWVRDENLIRKVEVGASTLLIVDLQSVIRVVDEKAARGEFFYHMEQT